MNVWAIVIVILLVLIVTLAILRIRKNKKQGKPCGSGCSCCGMAATCDKRGQSPVSRFPGKT